MKPRVLYVAGREMGYMRNRVLLQALRSCADVTVLRPRVPTTTGRTAASLASFVARRPDYDALFVGFYGQMLGVALARMQRKPIILDAYVSTFDTLCHDRRWFGPGSVPGRLAFWLDRQSCLAASRVVTDTRAHARYFAETFDLPAAKLQALYVGCDETLFHPIDAPARHGGRIEVFTYGAFLALHGTEVVVEAASRLRHRADLHWSIGGHGPRFKQVRQIVAQAGLRNVDLVGWVPLSALPAHIARASICLGGHFSRVPKAARVVSTKTFQFLAMARPTIVGDNEAVNEILTHGDQAWLVPMGDAEALAGAVEILAGDAGLRERLAAGGRRVFEERLSTACLAGQVATVLEEALCTSVS
ncbi:MAG: glycosyltransferase family 4 protein [Anaerolineaceae bacterium]|nr:glycosyltransferase family 4 protein [Anaerolineaceae bacterium]